MDTAKSRMKELSTEVMVGLSELTKDDLNLLAIQRNLKKDKVKIVKYLQIVKGIRSCSYKIISLEAQSSKRLEPKEKKELSGFDFTFEKSSSIGSAEKMKPFQNQKNPNEERKKMILKEQIRELEMTKDELYKQSKNVTKFQIGKLKYKRKRENESILKMKTSQKLPEFRTQDLAGKFPDFTKMENVIDLSDDSEKSLPSGDGKKLSNPTNWKGLLVGPEKQTPSNEHRKQAENKQSLNAEK